MTDRNLNSKSAAPIVERSLELAKRAEQLERTGFSKSVVQDRSRGARKSRDRDLIEHSRPAPPKDDRERKHVSAKH